MRNVCCEIDYPLWIDDLPLIDIELLSKSASSSDVTGKRLFEKCVRLAGVDVVKDVTNGLIGKVEFGSVIESDIHGTFITDKPDYTQISKDKYFVRTIRQKCDDPYVSLRLDYIELFATNASPCEEICIWDGCEITTHKVKIKKGRNKIQLDLVGDYFAVFVSACNVSWQETEYRCYDNLVCGCCYELCDYESTDCSVEDMQRSQIKPIKMAVSCVCVKEEIVCRFKKELEMAMLYKTAAWIFDSVSTSKRDNPLVRSSKEDAKDKIAVLIGGVDSEGMETKRKESKYWPEIFSAQKLIRAAMKNSDCVICRGGGKVAAV